MKVQTTAVVIAGATILGPLLAAPSASAKPPVITGLHSKIIAGAKLDTDGVFPITFPYTVNLPSSSLCNGYFELDEYQGSELTGGRLPRAQRSLTFGHDTVAWPVNGLASVYVAYSNCATGERSSIQSNVVQQTVLDQTVASFSSGWTYEQSASSYGGSQEFTTQPGATVDLDNNVWSSIGIVAGKSPKAGKIAVYIDGVQRATVNLYASKIVSRSIVYTYNKQTNGTHSVRIVNVSASTAKRASIDAFVTLQQTSYAPGAIS